MNQETPQGALGSVNKLNKLLATANVEAEGAVLGACCYDATGTGGFVCADDFTLDQCNGMGGTFYANKRCTDPDVKCPPIIKSQQK